MAGSRKQMLKGGDADEDELQDYYDDDEDVDYDEEEDEDESEPTLEVCKSAQSVKFEIQEQLGDTGIDGATYKGIYTDDDGNTQQVAIKVFKEKKPLKEIKREVALQQRVAKVGAAPRLVGAWQIDENNKCFAMELMNRTLGQVLKEQRGLLTPEQVKGIRYAYAQMDKVGVNHNDSNVGRNIMEGFDGKMYVIDFGMSRLVSASKPSLYGPRPNMAMLMYVDRHVAAYAKKNPQVKVHFADEIRAYELRHNVTVDPAAKLQREIDAKLAKLTQRMP
jgi:predicted Ser/Thr protein kinase